MTDDIATPETANGIVAAARRRYGGYDVRPVNEIKAGVKLGIYGPGGAGKTTLVGTACDSPLGRPMLYLNARGNPHVIASRRAEVDVVDVVKFKDVESIRRDIIKDLTHGEFPYNSIALDNVSDMVSQDLRDRYGEMTNVQWTDHSATTADILNVVRNFSDIADNFGVNVFFVMWEAPEDREIRGQKVNRSELAMNKALQTQLPGIINWLGRLYVMDDEPRFTRCLDFRPIEKQQVSKYQIDPYDDIQKAIQMEIYDPHLGEIIDALKGGVPFPADTHKRPSPANAGKK